MSKAMDDYVGAQKTLETATARVEGMVRIIAAAGDHLDGGQWKQRVIGGVGGFAWPQMTNAPDLDIREHQWPTLQGLRDAMQAWHREKPTADNAWNQLSPDERKVMKRHDD